METEKKSRIKTRIAKLEERLLSRVNFYRYNYLKNWVIAAMDVGLAAGVSGLVFVMYAPITGPMGRLNLLFMFVMAGVASVIAFYAFKTHRIIIRYMTVKGLLPIGLAVVLKSGLLTLMLFSIRFLQPGLYHKFCLMDLLITLAVLSGVRIIMLIVYGIVNEKITTGSQKVLIYGIDEKSASLLLRFQKSATYRPVGFLMHDRINRQYRLNDLRVYHFETQEEVKKIARQLGVTSVIFSMYKDVQKEKDRLIHFCEQEKINIMMVPPVDEFSNASKMRLQLRPIAIEDLLGREEIHINMEVVVDKFRDKVVLVTGAAGSIGSEFCRQVAGMGVVKQLVLLDVAETPMHTMQLELDEHFPNLNYVAIIGDVRHKQAVEDVFTRYKPGVVFHAAAYKHVPLMESNACEAVGVNVEGTRIVADAAVAHGVEKFIFLSTDKAVNPTNIMGASKRLAEMYVQSLGLAIANGKDQGVTQFVTTRFGNVLGSSGSVIPYFRYQIKGGGPLTVTHRDITRFFMSIPEACRLIMEAATISTDNEIMVFDMGEPIRIWDMAERMIRLAGFTPGEEIEIIETGLRPGEKLYEEVLSTEENSTATVHPHIRIAQVRSNNYAAVNKAALAVVACAKEMDAEETVQLLKKYVPEFKSHNSVYEVYDV
ncbi:MAG: polysaccharide biosynthesis protein [Bacteroidales bacterium]|nr:polysaccharide biosynthesis protein [Bacteroidales bacterium]